MYGCSISYEQRLQLAYPLFEVEIHYSWLLAQERLQLHMQQVAHSTLPFIFHCIRCEGTSRQASPQLHDVLGLQMVDIQRLRIVGAILKSGSAT